jgi:hypothetical protein
MKGRTHVQAASNAGTLQRLLLSVLLTGSHETGHLILSQINLAATERREADVSDLELVGGSRHICGSRDDEGERCLKRGVRRG